MRNKLVMLIKLLKEVQKWEEVGIFRVVAIVKQKARVPVELAQVPSVAK